MINPRSRANLKPQPRKADKSWEELFFAYLKKHINIAGACEAAGISRFTAYERKKSDQEFSRKWDEIEQSHIDKVEQAAFVLAPGSCRDALEFLSRRRPDRWGKTPEVSITQNHISVITADAREHLISLREKVNQREGARTK